MQKNIEWHYKPIIADSDGQFSGPSWCSGDTQRAINGHEIGFGNGGLSHMQGAAVTLIEGRGHPALHREGVAQGRPTVAEKPGETGETGDRETGDRPRFPKSICRQCTHFAWQSVMPLGGYVASAEQCGYACRAG